MATDAEKTAAALYKMLQKNGGLTAADLKFQKKAPRQVNALTDVDLPKVMADHYKDMFNRIKEDALKSLPGAGLRTANRLLTDSIKDLAYDLAKAGKTVSKKIVDAFDAIHKKTNGDTGAHTAAANALSTYNTKLKDYHDLINTSPIKKGKKGYAAQQRTAKAVKADLNAAASDAATHGIDVKNVKQLGRGKKNVGAYAGEIEESMHNIAELHGEHAKNLEANFAKELNVRSAMLLALGGFILDIGMKVMDTTKSRLQNVLSSTDFSQAVMRGLSPAELNEWTNTNRNATTLLGKGSQLYVDGLTADLRKFGLNSKEAADQMTKLNNIQMNVGAGPDRDGANNLQDSIAKFQALTGKSQAEATAFAEQTSNNLGFLSSIMGKTNQERNAALDRQVGLLTRIARSTGFAADYFNELANQQRTIRNQSLVNKVTGSAMSDVLFKELVKGGLNAKEGDQEMLRARSVGLLDKDHFDPSKIADLDKRVGLTSENINKQSSEELLKKHSVGRFGSIQAVVDEVASRSNIDLAHLRDQSVGASAQSRTFGAAALQTDYSGLIDQSKKSLSAIEDFYLKAEQTLTGVEKSPAGSALGGIMDFGKTVATQYIAYKIFSGGGKQMLSSGFNAVKGLFGRGAVSAAGQAVAGQGTAAAGSAIPTAATGLGATLTGEVGAASAGTVAAGVAVAAVGGYAIGTGISKLGNIMEDKGDEDIRNGNTMIGHLERIEGGFADGSFFTRWFDKSESNILQTDMTSDAAKAQIAKTRAAIAAQHAATTGQQIAADGHIIPQDDKTSNLLEIIANYVKANATTSKDHLDYTKDKDQNDLAREQHEADKQTNAANLALTNIAHTQKSFGMRVDIPKKVG